MLRSSVPKHLLLAPTATDGGGGGTADAATDTMLESDPSAMSGWMKDLPSLDIPLANQKKEPDGKTVENTGGLAGSGVPAAAKPLNQPTGGDNAVAATGKQPADAAGAKPLDVAAKPDDAKAKEAALAAEKAAETAAKAGEKATEDKWPRSSADWDKYKRVHAEKEGKLQKEIEQRQEKIVTLETQIAEFQKKTVDSNQVAPEIQAQIDSLKKENDEMSRRLQVVDVTQHPKFQSYFANKVNAQKTLAKAILGEEKVAAFEEIVALPSGAYKTEKLDEFVSDLPTLQQVRIGNVLNSLETIEAERTEEIAKANVLKEQLTGEEKAKRENTSKSREKAINEHVASIQKQNPAYQIKPDDAAWNASVNERIAVAKKLLTGEGMKTADLIKAAFDAAQLPVTLQAYKADMAEKDTEIAKLSDELKGVKDQLSKLTAVQPKLDGGGSGGGSDNGTTTTHRPTSGQTPDEALGSFTKALWGAS